jgi:hypothetical protein
MVVVVPEPNIEPYKLIGAAVYTKNVAEQLSFTELAAIFHDATRAMPMTSEMVAPTADFHRVANGDGNIRSICILCYVAVAVTQDTAELDKAEEQHRCDLATDPIENLP